MIKRTDQFKKNEIAATAVEFALIAPLLVLLTVGTIQIMVLFYARHQLSDGLDRARRLLQIDSSVSVETLRAEFTSRYVFDADAIELTKELVNLTNGAVVVRVAVQGSLGYQSILPGLDWSTVNLETYVPQ